MINLELAVRASGGAWILPLVFILILVAHGFSRRTEHGSARDRRNQKIGVCVAALLTIVSFAAWLGILQAHQFDWRRDDASEVTIEVHASPDQSGPATHVMSVKDQAVLAHVFDALASTQPDEGNVKTRWTGESYVLRLRRTSDGQWSTYRLVICPDAESLDGTLSFRGAYQMLLKPGRGRFNLGRYENAELGRLVQRIVQQDNREQSWPR